MTFKRSMANKSKVTPAVRQAIKSVLADNQEHKIATFATPAGANWLLTGNIAEITRTVVQGDNIFQRSGDQITVKDLKLHINTASTGAGSATSYRIIVFADMTADGGVPAVTDVLDQADLRAAYQNFNRQRRRFKIMHDQYYTNVFGTVTQERVINLHFPRLHHKVYYNGSAAAATDNGKGALFMLVIASTTLFGQWAFLPQITYTDS